MISETMQEIDGYQPNHQTIIAQARPTIIRSPYPDVEIPEVSLPSFVLEQAEERAELVPPIVLALAKQPVVDRYDLSSLRVIASGAAPLGRELAQACAGRLGCRIKQGFGMTELGGGTYLAPDSGRDDPESVEPAECRVPRR